MEGFCLIAASIPIESGIGLVQRAKWKTEQAILKQLLTSSNAYTSPSHKENRFPIGFDLS
jgi:hypothetical protein